MIRVIIIEDDPMVAELAAGYLEGMDGFSLEHTAHSGEAGLALLRAHHVDLVLLDVFMPGMDGIELLRIIRAEFIHTDVIMITAAQNSEDILNALRMGVADYIVKPYTFERFRESLIQFREKRQLLISPEVSITQEMLDRRIFVKKITPGSGRDPKGNRPLHPAKRHRCAAKLSQPSEPERRGAADRYLSHITKKIF